MARVSGRVLRATVRDTTLEVAIKIMESKNEKVRATSLLLFLKRLGFRRTRKGNRYFEAVQTQRYRVLLWYKDCRTRVLDNNG